MGSQASCMADKKQRDKKQPATKKQRTSDPLSDGATSWIQLIQMEMTAQQEQVEYRLKSWSNEALCQEGLRLQGLEARLHRNNSMQLRCAEGARLPYNVITVGDVAIVSIDEPESAVLTVGHVTSLSGSMLQLALPEPSNPALLGLLGLVLRVDKGFQRTPFDRMQAALRRCDVHEPSSKVWEVVIPLVRRSQDVRSGLPLSAPGLPTEGVPYVIPAATSSSTSAATSSSTEIQQSLLRIADTDVPLLNASQQRALDATLTHPVSLIHGPPGTGKTMVLASVVHAALRGSGGTKILLLAETNTAVDNLVSAVLKSAGRCQSPLAPGELVRVGAGADSARPELAPCSLLHLATMHAWAADLCRLKEGMVTLQTPAEKKKRWASIMKLEMEIQRDLINRARVVATTLVGSGGALFQAGTSFAMVVFDEATQATLPAALIPLNLLDDSRPAMQRVVFAGDHKQLPPTVISRSAREGGLAVPVFELLIEAGVPPLLLATQYRMDPAISAFPLQHFYQGDVVDAPTAERTTSPAAAQLLRGVHWPTSGRPVALVRMWHTAVEAINPHGSKINPGEARAITECVARLRRACPALFSGGNTAEVAVLTHYLGQKTLIQANLRRAQQGQGVVVSTVDGFQGREAHMVLVSMVRANDRRRVGFLADQRRLNVALTRARSGLIVVGHPDTLRADEHLGAWLAWVESAGCCVGSVQELFPPAAQEKRSEAKREADEASRAAKIARAQLEAAQERAAARRAVTQMVPLLGAEGATPAPSATVSKPLVERVKEVEGQLAERQGLLERLVNTPEAVKLRSDLATKIKELKALLKSHLQARMRELQR